jgi:hypothetical protein
VQSWPAGQQTAPLRASKCASPDSRLKLAPCVTVQPYLPAGSRNARIGLRCADAGVRWNIFLPGMYGLVAATARAGTVSAQPI